MLFAVHAVYGQNWDYIRDSGEYYYDDQIIKTTKTKCFKQVGIYKYNTRAGIEKTVPIVKLMDK